jgi:hypothetical protein
LNAKEREEKRLEINILRDLEEQKIMGGFKKIFPLDEIRQNESRIEKYKKYLESSADIYDFFNNGRRKNGTMDNSITYEKKSVRKIETTGTQPWRGGPPQEKGYIWAKPSKYQLKNNVKSKVDTGLNPVSCPI